MPLPLQRILSSESIENRKDQVNCREQMLGQVKIGKENSKETKDIKDIRENGRKCLLIDTLYCIKTYIKI